MSEPVKIWWTEEGIEEFRRARNKLDSLRSPGVTNFPDSLNIDLPGSRPPPRLFNTTRSVLVKVTDPESGGGKYAGYLLRAPTTTATASGDLTEAEIGVTTDAQACLILNVREVGKSTHDLASSGFLPLVFLGILNGATSDGKPIVVIDGYQWEDDCP